MGRKVAMPLLGVLLWVLSVHSGSFVNAWIFNSNPVYGEQTYSQIYPSKQQYIKSPSGIIPGGPILKISEKNLNDSVHFGETILGHLHRLETNLGRSEVKVQHGTPAYGQLIENEASVEGLQNARAALVVARASQNLVNSHCQKYSLNKGHCAKLLTTFKMTSTPLENICSLINKSCKHEDIKSKYRSADGSCNHKSQNILGKSFTPYKRVLFPFYLDGIMIPRRSVTKSQLPSARLISSRIIKNVDRFDSRLTLAFMQWSQFIAHDMTHTASSKMISSETPIMCCDRSGYSLAPRYLHPMCMPISIPSNDQFYSKHRTNCMSYVRSLPAIRSDCSFGPIEQMNQATHYLDGSHIYGSTLNKSNSLREFKNGKLLTSKQRGRQFLPAALSSNKACQSNSDECFRAGDTRVNMQPHLTVMHTLWTREHNRIASKLQLINPHWTDEKLYQETRKIIIAEIQHITYTQWLPILIGKFNAGKINSQLKYGENVDPSVSNAFATAAIRFSNSLMTSELQMIEENRNTNSSVRLQDHFNKPVDLIKPGNLDGLIRGLATQKSQMMDLQFISDITQQLYKTGRYGMDALSLDIQRGRDHGLPPYNEYRELCGLARIETFNDLSDHISQQTVQMLSQTYADVNDIDLIVGALAEEQMDGSLLGPTFTCLISEQMLRTRTGDRHFYTNTDEVSSLTNDQLEAIMKTTLARIFCDNGDNIENMQPDVFSSIRPGNNLVDCSNESIEKLDLSKWTDKKSWLRF